MLNELQLITDGLISEPSLHFRTSRTTGLFLPAVGNLGLVAAGVKIATAKAAGLTVDAGVLALPNGTASLPTLTFDSDPNTGLYNVGADQIGISTGGTRRLLLDSTGAKFASGAILDTDGGTLTVQANAGAGAVSIGSSSVAHATTIGSLTGTATTTIRSGTGDLALTSTDAILLDAVGVLELNSSSGVIGIGNDAVAQNINIGTGAAARTITIGNVTGATSIDINAGTSGTITLNEISIDNSEDVTGVHNITADPGGVLALQGATSGKVTLDTLAVAGTWSLTLPPNGGTINYVLRTDGSGNTTWVAQTGGSSGLPTDHINGLIVSDATVSTKSIASGSCRSGDNTTDIVSAGTLTPNITSSGANGLDTGSEAANTWYSIWIIADSSEVNPVASLLSVSSSAPTMPSGYDKKRRIGWLRNDGSSNFYDYFSQSSGKDRFYVWRETIGILNVLSSGSATTFAAVSLAEFVPPTSQLAYLNVRYDADGQNNYTTLRPTGSSLSDTAHRVHTGEASDTINAISVNAAFWMETNGSQSIDYENKTSSEECYIRVLGFQDDL